MAKLNLSLNNTNNNLRNPEIRLATNELKFKI